MGLRDTKHPPLYRAWLQKDLWWWRLSCWALLMWRNWFLRCFCKRCEVWQTVVQARRDLWLLFPPPACHPPLPVKLQVKMFPPPWGNITPAPTDVSPPREMSPPSDFSSPPTDVTSSSEVLAFVVKSPVLPVCWDVALASFCMDVASTTEQSVHLDKCTTCQRKYMYSVAISAKNKCL